MVNQQGVEGGTKIFQAEGTVKQGGEGPTWDPESPMLHRNQSFSLLYPQDLAEHLAHNRCLNSL